MSGFYFVVVGSNGAAAWHPAPLQGVTVTGLIRDAVAEYTMTQTFQNPLVREHIDGAYTFPFYEGAAVTAFQAEVDGRTIQGRVAEKVAAREDYEAAVRDGKTASLLEQQSPELFHARIGNVPPGKTIVIRITVVSEIRHDGGDNHVRFVLPTAVAPRASIFGPVRGFVAAAKLHFDVGCAMTTPIASVQSPSHTIEVHVGESAGCFDPTRARVSLTEDTLLDRDLVVVVQCRGLDQPRALVERHARDGTHAVAVTFQPRFGVARVRAAELVFVVDVRSGALAARAAEALALFLRYVPLENHYFNVLARGSVFGGGALEALFPASVEATAESLRKGVEYAERLGSGSGSSALVQEALRRRRRDIPMQIFLITDGETADLAHEVRSENSFRLFALGIGDAISHHRIQSAAIAGRGYALVVTARERLEKKVSTMMRAALTPPVTETTIQWTDSVVEDDGEDEEEAKTTTPQLISLFSDSDTPLAVAESTPPPKISATTYQAPFTLPTLSPGARFTVYAILSPTTPLPKEVVVRGVTPDGPAELRVPLDAAVEGETMLHALAARALARDFEEAASSVHALARSRALAAHEKRQLKHLGVGVASPGSALPLSFDHVVAIAKQKLIDIGETYCLATKYTSWVAVDEDGPRNAREAGSYVVTVAHPTPCFGHNAASVFSGFGQQAPSSGSYHPVNSQSNSSLFGSSTPAFGAQCEPAFGASAFGAAPASAFGATPAFGSQFQASSTPAFGSPFQASSAQAFGGTPGPAFDSPFQSSSTQGFGSPFQASSAAAFGRTQAAGFGSTPGSIFGSPSQTSSASAFGSPYQASSAPGFGSTPTSVFGSPSQPSSAPAFGAPQPSAFGAPQPSAFGTPQPSAFGAPQPSALFGAQTVASPSQLGNAPAATDPQTQLQSLLQNQMFDGLFPLVPTIAAIFNTSVDALKARLGELRKQGLTELPEEQWDAIWATCLAVEFVKSKMPQLEQHWKLAVEKAERRVESLVTSPEHVARLKAAAKAL